jgi:hypothetical protein
MPTPLKSVVALVGSFVPVIYCGWLAYYFFHVSGSVQEAENNGLASTILGLAIVGLLFCIPLVVKLVLVFIELRKPRSDGGSGGSPHSGNDTFDADAVVARYMAQRPANAASGSPAVDGSGSASRPVFGRKAR